MTAAPRDGTELPNRGAMFGSFGCITATKYDVLVGYLNKTYKKKFTGPGDLMMPVFLCKLCLHVADFKRSYQTYGPKALIKECSVFFCFFLLHVQLGVIRS